MKRAKGLVLWRGPSAIDGAPIVVVLTGLRRRSKNPKTGTMLQTWILRSDINPVDAIYSGADYSICGRCDLRGRLGVRRTCYVRVERAPRAVWQAWRHGAYLQTLPHDWGHHIGRRFIRFGAYGDPIAAPYHVWSLLANLSSGWTGYSRQWRDTSHWRFRRLLMASVESEAQAQIAQSMGWRTFRTLATWEYRRPSLSEMGCPAAAENGHQKTCLDCRRCGGNATKAPNIAIRAHGGAAIVANYDRLMAR
jgi:hypothetical protein